MASRRRIVSRWIWPLAAAALAAAFLAGLWVGSRRQPAPRQAGVAESAPPAERPADDAGPVDRRPREETADRPTAERPSADRPPEPSLEPIAAGRARIALVVDDLGRSLEEVRALARLPVPITYAVLPFSPRAGEVAAELVGRGAEVLCHLPMEALDEIDPGPGALTLGMGREELVRATHDALDRVPGAVGVNNHMGSALTGDRAAMAVVMEVLAERGLFWLDSRTRPDTVGYRVARRVGVPAAERQVFLDGDLGDHDLEAAAVRAQFRRLLDLARREGRAIAIGHPYPVTLAVLGEELPRALAAGYEFVPVSWLVDRSGGLQG